MRLETAVGKQGRSRGPTSDCWGGFLSVILYLASICCKYVPLSYIYIPQRDIVSYFLSCYQLLQNLGLVRSSPVKKGTERPQSLQYTVVFNVVKEHSSPAGTCYSFLHISLSEMQDLAAARVHTLAHCPSLLFYKRRGTRETKTLSLLKAEVSNDLPTSIYVTFFFVRFSNHTHTQCIHNNLNIQLFHTLQTKFSKQWDYKFDRMHHTYT